MAKADLKRTKAVFNARFSEVTRLELQKALFKARGIKLIRHGLHSVEELEDEDRRNSKVRLIIDCIKAITIRNDTFNPKAFK